MINRFHSLVDKLVSKAQLTTAEIGYMLTADDIAPGAQETEGGSAPLATRWFTGLMLPDPLTTSPHIPANPNGNCSGPAISFQVKDPDVGAGRWYDSWISVSVGYQRIAACKPDDLVRILSRYLFSFIGHSDRFRFLSSYCRNELRISSITIINEILSCWKR